MAAAFDDGFAIIAGARRAPLAALANDGAGLAIVGHGDAASGRVELIDGVLRYSPQDGFAGVDAFSYRVRSAAGVETTATVSVTVAPAVAQPQSALDARIPESLPVSGRSLEIRAAALLVAGDGRTPLAPNDIATFGDRTFIVHQGSLGAPAAIIELALDPSGAATVSTFFDLGPAAEAASGRPMAYGGTTGLRSVAFHPDHAANGLFYAAFVQEKPAVVDGFAYLSGADAPVRVDSVLAEWRVDPDTGSVDPESYREVFRIGLPVRSHVIGDILFNPFAQPGDEDYGLLHVAVGDGSSQQALEGGGLRNDALGKILRIDPTVQPDGASFGVPPGNPFVDDPDVIDAAWSIGHRNPASMTFARGPDGAARLIAVEIGRDNVEEVNLIARGGNYGWSEREGPFVHLNLTEGAVTGVGPLPSDEALGGRTYPAAVLGHDDVVGQRSERIAATAGVVVANGSALDGQFLFADFAGQGRVYHVDLATMLAAKTRLSPGDPESDEPSELSWATPSELTLLVDHDGDPATTPVAASSLLDVVGAARSDIRMGAGARGELILTSKVTGAVYVATSTLPPDEARAVRIKAAGTAGAAFAVFADGRFVGESALGAPLTGADETGPESFVFALHGPGAPARVEIVNLTASGQGAFLRVEEVAFGGARYDGQRDGLFAAVAPGGRSGRVEALTEAGSLVFTAPGAPEPPEFTRVQAEDFVLGPGFGVARVGPASGGRVLVADRAGENWARRVFSGPSGVYDVSVAYFDENDATASARLRVNGVELDAWLWDRPDGADRPTAASFTLRTIDDVTLRMGDVVEFRGTRAAGEPLRTDYVDFAFDRFLWGPDAPPVIERIEAPDVDRVGGAGAVVSVLYRDAEGVDRATIDVDDIRVAGPDGSPLAVTGVSVERLEDGRAALARYAVAAPGGNWDIGDRGLYAVSVARDAVRDLAGQGVEELPDAATFEGPTVRRIEAEAFAFDAGFTQESLGSASGRKVLRARPDAIQSAAAFSFDGAAGLYEARLTYYDESDGAATLAVFAGGTLVDEWVWDANVAGSATANAAARAVRALGVVALAPGDVIELRGARDAGEPLRIDHIEIARFEDIAL
jgi:hypothetical protein